MIKQLLDKLNNWWTSQKVSMTIKKACMALEQNNKNSQQVTSILSQLFVDKIENYEHLLKVDALKRAETFKTIEQIKKELEEEEGK